MTASELTPRTVVWWKTSLSLVDIPRRHTIGWCDTSGTPFGTITIVSPHPRLDRRTIEAALTENLATTFPDPPRLGTAAEFAGEFTAEARLRAGGHAVLTRDLARVYGDHALGGVVATLLGKGVQAYVLIDQDASHAARAAICRPPNKPWPVSRPPTLTSSTPMGGNAVMRTAGNFCSNAERTRAVGMEPHMLLLSPGRSISTL